MKEEFFSESELDGVDVAEVDRKVVGYISFSKDIREDEWCGRYYRVDHLIVDEAHRRKGYGTKLLGILLQMAKNDDANIVTDTFVKNLDTVEFFKSLGFKPFETIFLLDRKKRLRLNKSFGQR